MTLPWMQFRWDKKKNISICCWMLIVLHLSCSFIAAMAWPWPHTTASGATGARSRAVPAATPRPRSRSRASRRGATTLRWTACRCTAPTLARGRQAPVDPGGPGAPSTAVTASMSVASRSGWRRSREGETTLPWTGYSSSAASWQLVVTTFLHCNNVSHVVLYVHQWQIPYLRQIHTNISTCNNQHQLFGVDFSTRRSTSIFDCDLTGEITYVRDHVYPIYSFKNLPIYQHYLRYTGTTELYLV